MKPKIKGNIPEIESPYKLFSQENNYLFSKNKLSLNNKRLFSNCPQSSKYKNYTNLYPKKNQIRPLSQFSRIPSAVSSISKTLKSMTLSSRLYGNYINVYSNITQEHTFKTPRITKYPILKNEKYLPITLHPSVAKETSKEKISFSTDVSNSIFLSYMKETKQRKKVIEEKPYGFKYGQTKIRFDRAKSANAFSAGKDFNELCEHNLFETQFLNEIGLKKIDMYNCSEEKKKSFKFLKEYIKRVDELLDIFNENNFHRNISFNGRTAIKKEKLNFKLDIFSLCFKFFSLNDSNLKKESQKLYFPFELMPLFYLLDFTSFKVLLSEIITYDQSNKSFTYIKDNLLIKKVKRYFNYISNSLEKNPKYINNIIFNKNETVFPLIYDWIVSKNPTSEEEEEKSKITNENNNYKCFKLKIVLPKIKFSIEEINMKIIKLLNKQMVAKLLQNKFKNWQKFIFFDLFSTKKFKIISNLIMLNRHYKIPEKKITLNKKHQIQNKVYEFFLTQIGENNSLFYTFIPYIVLIVFGEKNKKYQKINLNLKESKNIIKFGKSWGIINTLFKCMFIDTLKNKIFFKFNLLEDDKNELYKIVIEENSKQNSNNDYTKLKSTEINKNGNHNFIKKVSNKNPTIKDKEKEKDNFQTKYKDNIFEISLLNCSLLKINITAFKSEKKYYIIPPKILKCIFSIKDENKIFNTSLINISKIAKCIGENSSEIISAKEADIIPEEQAMIKKAKIKDELSKYENIEQIPRHQDGYNRIKTFEIFKNNNNFMQKETMDIKIKENTIKLYEKQDSTKFSYEIVKPSNHKKVSISDINSLKKSRIEFGERNNAKRKTLKIQNEE